MGELYARSTNSVQREPKLTMAHKWSLFWLMFCLILIVAPQIAPYDPLKTDVSSQNQPPSAQHILGTDYLGRDLLTRMIYGAQITVGRAGIAAIAVALAGLVISSAAYLIGHWSDAVIRVLIDAVLAIPSLITALVTLTLTGRDNPNVSMILALSISQIAPFTLVARTAILAVQSEPYCEAAVALGAGRWHLLKACILPNCSTTLLAYARVVFAYCLLNGAALGFLGLGGEPGTPEWGVMLAEARLALRASLWPALWPGLALTLLVWLVNAAGRHSYPRE